MGLFDLKEGQIVLHPDSLALPPFKRIWNRDKGKGKEKATKEIAYIYYVTDFKSPYSIYPEDRRKTLVAEDFMKDIKYKPDKDVIEAIGFYKKLRETTSMYVLEKAKSAVYKLADYFDNIDFKETDEVGRPIYSAKDVSANLEKVGKIVESLDKLEEKVRKEIKTTENIRGGGEIGDYER